MMLSDFLVKVDALFRRKNEDWRHTRLIVGALAGKDPRFLIPLPGDFENLEVESYEDTIKKAEKMGMKLSDEFKANMLKNGPS